jgi:hypothetical protein
MIELYILIPNCQAIVPHELALQHKYSIMNYTLHYNTLIFRAQNRDLDSSIYVEKHHIIPRCMGGNDTRDNLVNLTAEEHFIAHLLLMKMYPSEGGLLLAVHQMISPSSTTSGRQNKKYGVWRKQLSSKLTTLKWWNNGVKNKRSIESPGTEWRLGMVNPPWNKGKSIGKCWTNGDIFVIQKSCPGKGWVLGSATKGKSYPNRASTGWKGFKWWTNGQENKRSIENPGPGWYIGFSCTSKGSKGMKWWNNGVVSKLSLQHPGPEWIRGRLSQSQPLSRGAWRSSDSPCAPSPPSAPWPPSSQRRRSRGGT